MKPARGSSLYEVLKNASRPAGEEGGAPAAEAPAAGEAPATTLQERLAAYKAQKLAAAQAPAAEVPAREEAPAPAAAAVAVAVAPPPPVVPSAPTMVLKPEPASAAAPAALDLPRVAPKVEVPAPPPVKFLDPLPTPLPTPTPAPAGLDKVGPGERVLKLTYNTAAFSALVIVGLVFLAYALGIHKGRSATEATVVAPKAPAPSVEVAAPVLPPAPAPVPTPALAQAPRKDFTIRLMEWKYGTAQERLKANAAADEFKRALEKAGHRGVEKAVVKRGGELRLALYSGTFQDMNSEAARAKLATLRAFKSQNTTPFSQAVFEEAPK